MELLARPVVSVDCGSGDREDETRRILTTKYTKYTENFGHYPGVKIKRIAL